MFWLARFLILLIAITFFGATLAAMAYLAHTTKAGWAAAPLIFPLLGIQRWVRWTLTWFCVEHELDKLQPETDPVTGTVRALGTAWINRPPKRAGAPRTRASREPEKVLH